MSSHEKWLERRAKWDKEALWQEELLDRSTADRMMRNDSNFYGMHRLMHLIESLAYISMEAPWPKPKK